MFVEKILKPIVENIHKFSTRNAYCINDVYYTYDDLGKAISKIRKCLKSKHISDKNIGLVANDDLHTYASMIALWMEGKSYVPLHPLQPIERCEEIMKQINTRHVLDSSENTRYQGYDVLETTKLEETEEELLNDFEGSDEEVAYILFTSGSTGVPKGVMLSRKNLYSFVDAYDAIGYKITEDDRCLQCFDLTFDLSIGSYIIPLVKGACAYTVQLEAIKYSRVYELLEDYELTSALMVPSTIRYLQPYFDEINLPKLRYSLFCGEALHEDVLRAWKKCVPNAIVDNVYGPTENTIYCTYYRCGDTMKSHNGILSIGKPMENVELQIIDEKDQFITGADSGELCLAGNQLTLGYINNPEKNKEAFFYKDGIRYYKTGDICYRDADGDFMYIGRKDSQAKIQGFRVELSEIEYHAKKFLSNKDVVCIAFENTQKLTELVLFIESETFNSDELVNYLKKKLPSYMVPSHFMFVPVFPLNKNGKTDKVQLKKLIDL